jgi:hypothetical protein
VIERPFPSFVEKVRIEMPTTGGVVGGQPGFFYKATAPLAETTNSTEVAVGGVIEISAPLVGTAKP